MSCISAPPPPSSSHRFALERTAQPVSSFSSADHSHTLVLGLFVLVTPSFRILFSTCLHEYPIKNSFVLFKSWWLAWKKREDKRERVYILKSYAWLKRLPQIQQNRSTNVKNIRVMKSWFPNVSREKKMYKKIADFSANIFFFCSWTPSPPTEKKTIKRNKKKKVFFFFREGRRSSAEKLKRSQNHHGNLWCYFCRKFSSVVEHNDVESLGSLEWVVLMSTALQTAVAAAGSPSVSSTPPNPVKRNKSYKTYCFCLWPFTAGNFRNSQVAENPRDWKMYCSSFSDSKIPDSMHQEKGKT